ncbi:MAG: ATP-dependent Clp protease adaptor ClpS [Desulfobacteraceae bacterium]|nr:ATP-dependent Clp protease adaptor ClpS [Desulfobacteraceae bacterium]MCB9495166.1 ATP-dependent Clp protease adaptor ClpS [Desulfobacteraceae bacterium]
MAVKNPGTEQEVVSDISEKITEPPLYKVLLHNDDYTTMDFVVDILITVFHKSQLEAEKIMLNVHKKGVGICGVYPYELAETKVETVTALAKNSGFPLKSTMEKA